VGLTQTAQTDPVDNHAIGVLFDLHSHGAEARNRRQTICPRQKMGNLGFALGDCIEHDGTVRDGFVTGHRKSATKTRRCTYLYRSHCVSFVRSSMAASCRC
jgi:hypothetical protein